MIERDEYDKIEVALDCMHCYNINGDIMVSRNNIKCILQRFSKGYRRQPVAYQKKYKDAVDKLEKTEKELERVRAVVGEHIADVKDIIKSDTNPWWRRWVSGWPWRKEQC